MGRTTAATTFIALLRGINVGRARQVAMADLREIAESLGYRDVCTLLRSGNLVFSATAATAERVAAELGQAIEARLGMVVGVVVRTADELAAIVQADPLSAQPQDGSRRHVIFLVDGLPEDVRGWLASDGFAPDTVRPAEREIYVWYERGMSGSETAGRIGKRLPRTATDRNWNTVTKLLEIARDTTYGNGPM
jgi:uncharacterized protein (DUF1697 family)